MARSSLAGRTPKSANQAGFALDAVIEECLYILGPTAIAIVAVTDARLGLPVATMLMGVSAVMLPVSRKARGDSGEEVLRTINPSKPHPSEPDGGGTRLALASVLGAVVIAGLILGSDTVALTGLAELRHERAFAGLFLSAISVGSIVGGLLFGRLPLSGLLIRKAGFLSAILAVTSILPFLVGLDLGAPSWVVLVAVLISGLCLSPLMTVTYLFMKESGTATVARYSLTSSAKNGAVALGAAAVGLLRSSEGILGAVTVIGSIALTLALGLLLISFTGKVSPHRYHVVK
jgi:hypothetical protein